jgi:hypothetical protein
MVTKVKVHMQKVREHALYPFSLCGRFRPYMATQSWEKVSCKKCLVNRMVIHAS